MDNMRTPWLRPVEPSAPPTHEALVGLVANGDQSAFGELYDAVASRVFGLVRRIVPDLAQGLEVTQEVFVDIWRLAARFDPKQGNAMSWILGITHRRAVERMRLAPLFFARELHQGMKPDNKSHDDTADVESGWDSVRFHLAMHTLTDQQQEAIQLAYYRGYTYEEVADFLNVSVETTKTSIRDGMIKLRNSLGLG